MTNSNTGIDRRGDSITVATVGSESGRVTIERLQQLDAPPGSDPVRIDNGRVTLAVPGQKAIVKPVRLEVDDGLSTEDRLRFELAQSLLEGEDSFIFAHQYTGDDGRYLGMVFRREHTLQICESCGLDYESLGNRLSFQLRSIALGQGYLTFCRKEESELICLADLAGGAASICFIYGGNIVEVASLSIARDDLASQSGREQFAVNLKTIVNYKQAALMDAGICVPVSSLLFSGESVDDDFRRTVQVFFPAGVNQPRLHDGFLGDIADQTRPALPLLLVALGLAVN